MELEELQKIWNEQKGENMYAINETAMHQSISRKKDAAQRKINIAEIGVMLINSVVAVILFIDALDDSHNWDFLFSGVLAFTVFYILYHRKRRLASEKVFDRSMLGELDHAISSTKSIVRFNYLMIVGYLLPMTGFVVVKFVDQGASWEKWLFISGMHILALLLLYFERKKQLLPRQKKLELLRNKLDDK